jgi:hypothetical protein
MKQAALLLLAAFVQTLQAEVFRPAGSAGGDMTGELAAALSKARDGGELFLPKGRYFIRGAVAVENVKDFTLRGEKGTVIVTHACPTGFLNECNGALKVRNAENFRLENIVFTSDEPTGSAGKIVALNPEDGTFDVEIDRGFPASGKECVASLDSCSPEGMPDRRLSLTGKLERKFDARGQVLLFVRSVAYGVVAPRILRFVAPGAGDCRFERLRTGDRIAIRYSLWGGGLISFAGVRGATVRDVTVERCIAMAVVVEPRSSDFVFERFRIAPPEGSNAIFSSNADGIHILGLSGRLVLDGCCFRGLGDDALNVHSRAGIVKSVGGDEVSLISRGYSGDEIALSAKWAQAGDRISFYDPCTFARKGELALDSFAQGVCKVEGGEFRPAPGDLAANMAFAPAVEIVRSECSVMRARAFLLQTDNVSVRGCRFADVALPALLFAPDAERWYEMSPSRNVKIEGNVFERCAAAGGAAVDFRCSHNSSPRPYPPGVHSDISVTGNRFERCAGAAISMAGVSGVEISDNGFLRCGDGSPLRILHCDKVRIDGKVAKTKEGR